MTKTKTSILSQLEKYFGKKELLRTDELYTFFVSIEPDISDTMVTWRIFSLKEDGILNHVGRGLYSLVRKNSYIPPLSALHKKICNTIQKDFPYLIISIWDTAWFNHFMNFQTGRNYIVLETEKDAREAVFHNLSEKYRHVFLSPDQKTLERYSSDGKESIIIKSWISESPWLYINKTNVSSLEKMLVDCIAEDVILAAQQTEIEDIFRNALERYNVNVSKARRYARRRNCLKKFDALIEGFTKPVFK